MLVYVIFNSSRVNEFEEGKLYRLVGWQKFETLHNSLYVN